MTNDPTQQYETNPPSALPPAAPDPAVPDPAVPDPAAVPPSGTPPSDPPRSDAPSDAATVAVAPVAASGASKARWLVALGVVAVAAAVVVGALLFFGKTSAPDALAYIPGDSAFVMELRMDLPGDQLQNVGNLLAHFPGFQDQSTLTTKIDEALKRLVAESGSGTDYEKDIKPFISGPMFVGIQSFQDMVESSDPKNFVVVATTNGAVSCDTVFEGATGTNEPYNGLDVAVFNAGQQACAIDGRFFLIGDEPGIKAAIDAHKAGTGLDKSTRYADARSQLGLDRLATMYIDGGNLARALPTSATTAAIDDLEGAFPQWIMAGLRAENDALVVDAVVAPPNKPAAVPSFATFPPVHAMSFTAFAPTDTLVFADMQGFGVSMHNVFSQLTSDPQFSAALQQLDQFGGLDGLLGWIDEAGFVVMKDGDTPSGAIFLAATDAAGASAKVTALETVLGLGALGGDFDVSTSTVEGVKVTTIHIPDAGSLSGMPTGSPIPLDLSIAAKDKVVIMAIGTGAMEKVLGVKPGASISDDPAFTKALSRGLANPQVAIYVAAGASIDWLDSAAAAAGGPGIPADLKPYLDPVEGFIYTVTGDGLHGSFRMALTVGNP